MYFGKGEFGTIAPLLPAFIAAIASLIEDNLWWTVKMLWRHRGLPADLKNLGGGAACSAISVYEGGTSTSLGGSSSLLPARAEYAAVSQGKTPVSQSKQRPSTQEPD